MWHVQNYLSCKTPCFDIISRKEHIYRWIDAIENLFFELELSINFKHCYKNRAKEYSCEIQILLDQS